MDIGDEMATSSQSSIMQIDSNIGEMAIGIDNEENVPVELNINESISTEISTDDKVWPEFDLGKYLGNISKLSDEQKRQIFKNRWVPAESYNFRADTDGKTRPFKHNWLKDYEPWLTYSKKLKGSLCLYCVLFPPTNVKGVLGAFIKSAFKTNHKLHASCQSHATNPWHRAATLSAKSFMEDVPVDIQMIAGHEKIIEENRQILKSIISTIIFCGTHDIAVRGKQHDSGNFPYFYNLCFSFEL